MSDHAADFHRISALVIAFEAVSKTYAAQGNSAGHAALREVSLSVEGRDALIYWGHAH